MATLGETVRQRRDELNWTLDELAEKTGLHKLQIQRIETNTRKKLSTAEILSLSRTLGVKVDDLLNGVAASETKVRVAAGRLLDVGTTPNLHMAASRVSGLLALSEKWQRGPVRTPKVIRWWTLPAHGLEKDKGTNLARTLRHELDYGDEPLEDLQRFCEEEFGLSVVLEPLEGNVRGLLVRVDSGEPDPRSSTDEGPTPLDPVRGYALVNTAGLNWMSQRFTIAHELGHHLFDDEDEFLSCAQDPSVNTDLPAKNKFSELRADYFAVELLLPESAVRAAEADHDWSSPDAELRFIANLALRYQVSWEVATNRASEVVPSRVQKSEVTKLRRDAALRRLGLFEEWVRVDHGPKTALPPFYEEAAKSAYREGQVDIYELAQVMKTDDAVTLKAQLAGQGYAPAV